MIEVVLRLFDAEELLALGPCYREPVSFDGAPGAARASWVGATYLLEVGTASLQVTREELESAAGEP